MNMFLTITWDVNPEFFQAGFLHLRYYAFCWGFAFAAGYYILLKIYKREQIDKSYLESLFFYVAFGAMLGARLGHCLFYNAEHYLTHPIEMFLPFSKNEDGNWILTGYTGLASHGGAIGIIISLLIYCYKKKVNFWDVTDKLGIVAPLGGCFIRIGNFFNSEIIGKATDVPWAVLFKKVDAVPRHPSQLYEAISYLLLFVFLYYHYIRYREKHNCGFYFALSLALIFISRFFIEYTKEVQEFFELSLKQTIGMDMGQLLSLPFIIFGVVWGVLRWKKQSV